MNWQVKGSDAHRQSNSWSDRHINAHTNMRGQTWVYQFTDSTLQCHLTKHLRFQLSLEKEESWGKCWPLHWINCAQSVTRSWEKKNSSRRYILMNKIIGFEKGGKQCHSSIPPESHKRRKKKEEDDDEQKEERFLWTDAHTSDLLTALTAARLIVTSCWDISISVWPPQAPAETEAGWPFHHKVAGLSQPPHG